MTSQTLADSDGYRITLHRAARPARRVLVTFGGQPSGLSDSGFGTDFALEQGYDTVFVAQAHGTQYQALPLETFAGAVAPVLEGRDVCAYGSSLGAWAALYYGGSIDARILAAAPMLPAHPAMNNRAYRDLPLTHRELWQVPRSRHAPVIAYDPELEKDAQMVAMAVAAYPDARLVPLPFAGHTVLVTLSRARLLKPFVLGVIERDEIIALELPTETSAIWHTQKGRKAMQARDPESALHHFLTALDLEPARNTLSMALNLLLREQRMDAAQALIDRAEASGNLRLTIVPFTRRKCREAGLRLQPEG